MWTCSKCGEQLDDQFKFYWKCGRAAANPVTASIKESLTMDCPRCKTALKYLGRKRFYEGGRLQSMFVSDFFVNRENFDLYVCSQCGYLEFFLEGVGEEFRPKGEEV